MAEQHTKAITAATGKTELHSEPTAFGIAAPGFVALSMLVVIGILIWQRVPGLIARALDGKIATIRTQLEEASRLRAEAEALLAKAQAQTAASAGDAAAIIAHAEAEAKTMLADAETHAAELTTRRAKMAEDKIAAAERSAIGEIRARAASVAATVAAQVIAQNHGAGADRTLVNGAIARLN